MVRAPARILHEQAGQAPFTELIQAVAQKIGDEQSRASCSQDLESRDPPARLRAGTGVAGSA